MPICAGTTVSRISCGPLAVALTVLCLGAGLAIRPAGAQPAEDRPDSRAERDLAALGERVQALESRLGALTERYEARLAELEARLAALDSSQASPSGAPAPPRPDAAPASGSIQEVVLGEAERAELEREPAELLGDSSADGDAQGPAPATTGEQRFTGRARTLNQLNPEISVTGDVFATIADRTGDPESNQFRFAEFEMAFQSPLDPFSLAKAFVVQEDGEFALEEAYIDWTSLPGGVGLKVGAFRHDWGKLNRWHQHALPQADRPLVHDAIFGEEGLRGLGASFSYLPGAFLGDYNEVVVQVTNDENGTAFSGRGFDEPIFLVHETNYWDLSSATYLELGVSAATGVNDELGRFRSQVYGIDWNLDWRPPAQALYTGLEVRGELLWQHRAEDAGAFDTLGAYTYGSYKLNRQWFVGLRGDWTELPFDRDRTLWGVSPFVEWWQSEWARLRLQYSYNSGRIDEPESENRFFSQITWAIGPHKHEKY